MRERTTCRSVNFSHPFFLRGIDGEQPAGTYEIETVEELIDGLSFIAYRRISTTIVLPSPANPIHCRQAETIDPRDLEAAEKRDALRREVYPSPEHRRLLYSTGSNHDRFRLWR